MSGGKKRLHVVKGLTSVLYFQKVMWLNTGTPLRNARNYLWGIFVNYRKNIRTDWQHLGHKNEERLRTASLRRNLYYILCIIYIIYILYILYIYYNLFCILFINYHYQQVRMFHKKQKENKYILHLKTFKI